MIGYDKLCMVKTVIISLFTSNFKLYESSPPIPNVLQELQIPAGARLLNPGAKCQKKNRLCPSSPPSSRAKRRR